MKKLFPALLISCLFAGVSHADEKTTMLSLPGLNVPPGMPGTPFVEHNSGGIEYQQWMLSDRNCEWQPINEYNGDRRIYCPKGAVKDYKCEPTIELINKCFPKMPWERVMEERLNEYYGIMTTVLPDNPIWERFKKVMAIRAMNPLPAYDWHPIFYQYSKAAILKILASLEDTEKVYSWAMPAFKNVLGQLPKQKRDLVLDVIHHALDYSGRFSFVKEQQYLSKLQKENREKEFNKIGPDGKESAYRDVEAFVFRRVRDGMKIEDIKTWIKKIVADIEPFVKND